MFISVASGLIGILFCFIIVITIQILLNCRKRLSLPLVKFLLACCCFTGIRVFIPLEFSFTHTIESHYILPEFSKVLAKSIVGMKISYIATTIWILVTFIIAVIRIKSYIRLKKLLRYGRPVENSLVKEIIESTEKSTKRRIILKIISLNYISEPFIFGIFHPIIVLPEKCIDNDKLGYIIKHELGHYLHHDMWVKFLVEMLCVIQWWNPVVYILKRQMTNILEFNNDLTITDKISDKERISYLECLIEVAEDKCNRNPRLSLGFYQLPKSLLKKRFLSVLDSGEIKTYKKYYILYLLFITLFIASLSVVVEPVYITPDKMEGSFEINSKNTYLQKVGEGYEIIVDNKVVGMVDTIPEGMKNFTIKGEENER